MNDRLFAFLPHILTQLPRKEGSNTHWNKSMEIDDDFDEEDYEDFLSEDDDWEDKSALANIQKNMPEGWYMIMKVTGMSITQKAERIIFVVENLSFTWRLTKRGFVFANDQDLVHFRLRW